MSVLQALLSRVNVPKHALVCIDKNCKDKAHTDDLETYYGDIVICLCTPATMYPIRYRCGIQKHWWTPELESLKQECIGVTDMWSAAAHPRS